MRGSSTRRSDTRREGGNEYGRQSQSCLAGERMSYTVELIVGELPANDRAAWKKIEELREVYYEDERERSPKLVQLHEVLTSRYPCLCSYADDDSTVDDW